MRLKLSAFILITGSNISWAVHDPKTFQVVGGGLGGAEGFEVVSASRSGPTQKEVAAAFPEKKESPLYAEIRKVFKNGKIVGDYGTVYTFSHNGKEYFYQIEQDIIMADEGRVEPELLGLKSKSSAPGKGSKEVAPESTTIVDVPSKPASTAPAEPANKAEVAATPVPQNTSTPPTGVKSVSVPTSAQPAASSPAPIASAPAQKTEVHTPSSAAPKSAVASSSELAEMKKYVDNLCTSYCGVNGATGQVVKSMKGTLDSVDPRTMGKADLDTIKQQVSHLESLTSTRDILAGHMKGAAGDLREMAQKLDAAIAPPTTVATGPAAPTTK